MADALCLGVLWLPRWEFGGDVQGVLHVPLGGLVVWGVEGGRAVGVGGGIVWKLPNAAQLKRMENESSE